MSDPSAATVTRRRFLKFLAGGVVTVGGLGTLDAVVVEPYSIEVTRHAVQVPGGPPSMPPTRVAFMSDFHRSWTTSRAHIRRAVQGCNQEQPDVVLVGGDYISRDVALAEDCAAEFAELRAPRGVYFVLGNHDYWHGPEKVRGALRAAGLRELKNASVLLGDGLHLVGVDDAWAGRPDPALAFAGTEVGGRFVFTHNPMLFPALRERKCVVVCGHTHGGQVVIPYVPNPYMRQWGDYVKGWFHEGNSHMYVNRGIGTLSLPIRFRCRPEITVFNLEPPAPSS